jgi:hypothetical protein
MMVASIEVSRSPDRGSAQTLGEMYLQVEREGARRAIARWREVGQWQPMPTWRFYRQVIRVALFLRDRARVVPGDRVVVASEPRIERVVAQWAIATLGGVAVMIDPRDVRGLQSLEPGFAAAFVSAAVSPEWVAEAKKVVRAETLVGFEGGPHAAGVRAWSEILEFGGTLDTAERAQSFRSQAVALLPSMPVLVHVAAGGSVVATLTQGDMVARVRTFWAKVPSRDGDVAYVVGGASASALDVALWAFVADGRTSIVFGAPEGIAAEMGEVSPTLVVGTSADVSIARRIEAGAREPGGDVSPLQKVGRLPLVGKLVSRFVGQEREFANRPSVRAFVTLDGARVG